MKSSAFYAVLGVGVLVMICVAWLGVSLHSRKDPNTTQMNFSVQGMATSSASAGDPSLAGLAIYTNGQYGFSVFYPQSLGAHEGIGSSSPIVTIGSAKEGVEIFVREDARSVSSCAAHPDEKLHDGVCFEILQVSSSTAPDQTLQTIAKSFSFARP